MMLDHIFNHLNKFTILSVFITISIPLAGFLYVIAFASTLGYGTSLFDLGFYTFLEVVLISDIYNVIIKFSLLFICFLFFGIIYPKSLQFVTDIFHFFALLVWGYLGLNFLKLLYSIKFFRYLFGFAILFISPILIFVITSLSCLFFPIFFVIFLIDIVFFYLKKSDKFNEYMKNARSTVEQNPDYEKIDQRMKAEGDNILKIDFFKGCIALTLCSFTILLWFLWIDYIKNQGIIHAEYYLYIKPHSFKTIHLVDGESYNAIFVSKVKNGHLFVLEDKDKCRLVRKAEFFSDSTILRIE